MAPYSSYNKPKLLARASKALGNLAWFTHFSPAQALAIVGFIQLPECGTVPHGLL